MFSVVFPGQGSQFVGMGKELHSEFSDVRELFQKADDALDFPLSKMILEGPKELLDETENTQPAIFLASYSIFNVIKNEKIDLNLIRYLTIRVKKFDLDTEYFSNTENQKDNKDIKTNNE